MKEIEVAGKTVDEAVESALSQLRALREEVEIEVLSEPKAGLFGILGGKEAVVRVKVREKPSKNLVAMDFLQKVFTELKVHADISIEEKGGYTYFNLNGNGLGVLIGRRGETLDALQYLVNLATNKQLGEKTHIILDVSGYREKRQETLTQLANKLARKAKKTSRNIVLEPMNPQERRVIHTALQNDPYVYTMSEGEEPYRKVVIALKRSR